MLLLLFVLLTSQHIAAPAQAQAIQAEPPLVDIRRALTGHQPDAEALGHTGRVALEVVVQPDGVRGAVAVTESSRSELLDAEAVRRLTTANFQAPAEATRYRVIVEFQAADDQLTCGGMARQVRWFQQTWPDRPLTEMALYSMSSGLLLLAGSPAAPNRDSAGAAVSLNQRLEADFAILAEDCERQPDRPWYPMLGEWARRQRGAG